jgi:4-hydroxybenzoate polyprenyltransferase
MLSVARRLLELIRFSHTIFALPFALLSALIAWQDEPFRRPDLVGIVLCMVFARSAAMAFNRIVDRRFDAANPRTAGRHLPTGTLRLPAVVLFTILCALGFVASTLLFYFREPSNPWPLYLSVPVLLFIGGYSLTKRFTSLAHFWLGASLMLAPLAAWIAIRGLRDLATPAVIGLAVLFWVAGFDVLYASQDVDFDRSAQLRSIPARWGIRTSLHIALICHTLMLAMLLVLYFVCPHLGAIYLIGLAAIAALLAYEHWIVRPDDLSRVNRAFFQVNGVISVGLFLLVALQLAVNSW